MKTPSTAFSQLYQKALRSHLEKKSRPDLLVIKKIGREAHAGGIPMVGLAKLHERLVVREILPNGSTKEQSALIRHAGKFFAAMIAEAELDNMNAQAAANLRKTIESLSVRTVELATSNRHLGLEITRRKKVEAALRKSELRLSSSLEKSELLEKQLRGFSRKILTVQEEERKKISRELHDVIAQALIGISVRLSTLKSEAGINAKQLARNITFTQKMVTKSAEIVQQFVRELRPTLLDDLGLIPALHSVMKSFTTQTGVRTHLTIFAGVEQLNSEKRTVLYRVAQEALTNVGRHARASNVEVAIQRESKSILMEVSDDGCSFEVERFLLSRGSKHLGLLGMRERIEMVGGSFAVESAPGTGTKIIARIPISKATERKWQIESAKSLTKKP